MNESIGTSTLQKIFFGKRDLDRFYANLYVYNRTNFWLMVILEFIVILIVVHFFREISRRKQEYHYSTVHNDSKLTFYLVSLFYTLLIDIIGWFIGWDTFHYYVIKFSNAQIKPF